MNLLDQNTDLIRVLCDRHKVRSLYAFGSVINEHFNSESDVDLIVDFEPIELDSYANNYFDFKFSLENILNRPIDLLEEKAIKNPYFRQAIDQKRKLIYAH